MLGRHYSSSSFFLRGHHSSSSSSSSHRRLCCNSCIIIQQPRRRQLQPQQQSRRRRHLRTSSSRSASTRTITSSRKLLTTTTTTISKRKKKTTTTNSTSTTTNPPPPPPEPCETPSDSKLLNAPRSRGRDDDALSRYPNFQSAGGILRGFDYVGTLTFALTGCVTAAQSGLDVFGCTMVATITAVGGGTIRDAVFLSKRPFWTSETEYIWMTVLMGLCTFFAWPYYVLEEYQNQQNQNQKKSPAILEEDGSPTANNSNNSSNNNDNNNHHNNNNHKKYDKLDAVLDTLDAIGLAAFAIVGAQNGVRAGMPMVVSAICGMSTSTFGGLTRDILCGRPVRIVHSNAEVYAFPALAGAVTYLVAKRLETVPPVRIGSALAVCMGSRYMAVKHDVKLHTWDTQNDGLGISVRK